MASELSRIENGAVDSSAIAPPPANTKGRTPGRKKNAKDVNLAVPPLNLPPMDTDTAQEDYEALNLETLEEAGNQIKQVVRDTNETLEQMETFAADYLSKRVNTSAVRVAHAVRQRTGGVNNAAPFRTSANEFLSDFMADLLSTEPSAE